MSLCAGIDFSTNRIDVAAIPFDPGVLEPGPIRTQFSVHRVGSPSDLQRPLDYQLVALDLGAALARLELWQAGPFAIDDDIVAACVEAPAGKVHPSLFALHGAILASLPSRIAASSIYPGQWRKALEVKHGREKGAAKRAGIARVVELWPAASTWDEHELDALGIATAWRQIQWAATPPIPTTAEGAPCPA